MFFPPLDIIFILLETLRWVISCKGLVMGGLDAKQAVQIMRMLFPVSARESRPSPPHPSSSRGHTRAVSAVLWIWDWLK